MKSLILIYTVVFFNILNKFFKFFFLGLFKKFSNKKRLEFPNIAPENEIIILENNVLRKNKEIEKKTQIIIENNEKNHSIIDEKTTNNVEKEKNPNLLDEKNQNMDEKTQNIPENNEKNDQLIDEKTRNLLENNEKIHINPQNEEENQSEKNPDSDTIEEMKLTQIIFDKNQRKAFENSCQYDNIRHLIDYAYESENESENSQIKQEEPFVILSDKEEDSDIEYIGSNKKIKNEEGEIFFQF